MRVPVAIMQVASVSFTTLWSWFPKVSLCLCHFFCALNIFFHTICVTVAGKVCNHEVTIYFITAVSKCNYVSFPSFISVYMYHSVTDRLHMYYFQDEGSCRCRKSSGKAYFAFVLVLPGQIARDSAQYVHLWRIPVCAPAYKTTYLRDRQPQIPAMQPWEFLHAYFYSKDHQQIYRKIKC